MTDIVFRPLDVLKISATPKKQASFGDYTKNSESDSTTPFLHSIVSDITDTYKTYDRTIVLERLKQNQKLVTYCNAYSSPPTQNNPSSSVSSEPSSLVVDVNTDKVDDFMEEREARLEKEKPNAPKAKKLNKRITFDDNTIDYKGEKTDEEVIQKQEEEIAEKKPVTPVELPEEDEFHEDKVTMLKSDNEQKPTIFIVCPYSDKHDKPGKASGEQLAPDKKPDDFHELHNISDWRYQLCNNYSKPFQLEGNTWNTVDHYMTYAQYKNHVNSATLKQFENVEAFVANKKNKPDADFESRKRTEMYHALYAKYSQNQDLLKTLYLTKDAKLMRRINKLKKEDFVELMWLRETMKEFSHYLIHSSVAKEIISDINPDDNHTKKRQKKSYVSPDLSTVQLGSLEVKLPKSEQKIVRASSYYMNNRAKFIKEMNEVFSHYRKEIIQDVDIEDPDSFTLLTHQKIVRDYINLYTPYRGLLLYHGLGSGKCHKKGTPIIMANGEIKLIENIQVGDLLMGDDSTPRTVMSLARGRDKMYDIIPVKGDKYTVNQEHILCLRASGFPKLSSNHHKSNTNYNVQWLENNEFCSKSFTFNPNDMKSKEEKMIQATLFFKNIQNNPKTSDNVYEISVKDYLTLSAKKRGFLKGYKMPIEFPEKELDIDPYMIGYWLGDGTSSGSSLTFQDSNVIHYFEKQLALEYSSGYTYNISSRNENNMFLHTLTNLNVIKKKHIPMIYKCNSRQNRLALLAGLLDSDGCLCKNSGFEFTQNNIILIDDVIYLARSLGFGCYKTTVKSGTAWRIHIHGKGIEDIPTLIPRKQASPRQQIKDVLVNGITVDYVGEDDYYGFTLDGNCRYFMGDFTVTHNTCTSIAIAEGMKQVSKQIYVMTPASLKTNYFEELQKCGDDLYKKKQYWEFVSIDGKPDLMNRLAKALTLSTKYIQQKKGAWMVDVAKPSNYDSLSPDQRVSLQDQIQEMISRKYKSIHYNAPNLKTIIQNMEAIAKNPFDNSVVIIDEAHNLVSRIVGKLKHKKLNSSVYYKLYHLLMDAENCRIIMLSGTPIINSPNEMAIIFNIIRGYIQTWSLPLEKQTNEKVNQEYLINLLESNGIKTFDYINITRDNLLTITRNPFGFINTKTAVKLPAKRKYTRKDKPAANNITKKAIKGVQKIEGGVGGEIMEYGGVKLDESGNIDNQTFLKRVIGVLTKNGLPLKPGAKPTLHNQKCLEDNVEEFRKIFLKDVTNIKGKISEETDLLHINTLRNRIMGLTSYFRSAKEELLPQFVMNEHKSPYHEVIVEMSDYQFAEYAKIRKDERDQEDKNRKNQRARQNQINNDELFEASSTFRIFSRACCNFAFPNPPSRPKPSKKKIEETTIDEDMFEGSPPPGNENEEESNHEMDNDYQLRIKSALEYLQKNASTILSRDGLKIYSPKFLEILNRLENPNNTGCHLLYSNFRTIEGIGILKLILEANGMREFKINKVDGKWVLNEVPDEDIGKPAFVLYTGTEEEEEKEIIRHIFNGTWDYIDNGSWKADPQSLIQQVRSMHKNNLYGNVIKLFMITSAGAEGINLRNTRFVHIVEPYWQNVRLEQVVGRARRIKSHVDLPPEMRTVQVFVYLSTLSNNQRKDDRYKELLLNDVGHVNQEKTVTTDEYLYELAQIKQKVNSQFLKIMKETAMDCHLYVSKHSKQEPLVCYNSPNINTNHFSSYPTLQQDLDEEPQK
jgi:hypothetical protein